MHSSDLLTIGEAAQRLGVSVATLRRWANDRRITVVILPTGHRRFRPEDVEKLRQPKGAA